MQFHWNLMVVSLILSLCGLLAIILANYNNPEHPGLITFSSVSQADIFIMKSYVHVCMTWTLTTIYAIYIHHAWLLFIHGIHILSVCLM